MPFSKTTRPPFCVIHPFIKWILVFFLRLTEPGRELDFSRPCTDQVKDEWNNKFSPVTHHRGVGRDPHCLRQNMAEEESN
jgi:hypothetical protein